MALILSPLSIGLRPPGSGDRALSGVRRVWRGLVLILILPRVKTWAWRAIGWLLFSLLSILLLWHSWIRSGEISRNRSGCWTLSAVNWAMAVLSIVLRRGSGRLSGSLATGLRGRSLTGGRAILISLGSWGREALP
jgi:hypothetical protein